MTEAEAKAHIAKGVEKYNRVRRRAERAEDSLIIARHAQFHLNRALMSHDERAAYDAQRERALEEAENDK